MGIAKGLVSEHGENPEYDRAIVELTCEVIGISTDNKVLVANVIGVNHAAVESWGSS